MNFSLVRQTRHYKCVECGIELVRDGDQILGVCTGCLFKRCVKAVQDNQPVKMPWWNARSN